MRLAVIPARGGSKRITKKNIRFFAGKPIIAYSIKAAQKCGLFDRIIVSTDDPEIGQIAKALGVEVPFCRPQELSNDIVGTGPVVKHAIEWLNKQGGAAEYVCCIYATAPFIAPEHLQEGFEKLVTSEKSYVFPVTSFPYPIQRAIHINKEGLLEAAYPEHFSTRSQDLEEAYHDAGQFYWGRAEAFLKDVVVFSNASMPLIFPRYMVQDIDTLEDWQRAELMYRAYCHVNHVKV